MTRPVPISVALLLLWFFAPTSLAGNSPGEQKYTVCAGCHGFQAQGLQLVHAPALAGQETWYLQRQMHNFTKSIRGGEADDSHGRSMALMIKSLTSDEDIAAVAEYINKLPPAETKVTLSGDVKRGATLFATCTACHGQNGTGNASLNAPALTGMDDWYMVAQLKKFKEGLRGKHPQDTWGAQMVPMMATLPDEQAIVDVVSYINTLQ